MSNTGIVVLVIIVVLLVAGYVVYFAWPKQQTATGTTTTGTSINCSFGSKVIGNKTCCLTAEGASDPTNCVTIDQQPADNALPSDTHSEASSGSGGTVITPNHPAVSGPCVYGGTKAGGTYKDGIHCLFGKGRISCPASMPNCWSFGGDTYYTINPGTTLTPPVVPPVVPPVTPPVSSIFSKYICEATAAGKNLVTGSGVDENHLINTCSSVTNMIACNNLEYNTQKGVCNWKGYTPKPKPTGTSTYKCRATTGGINLAIAQGVGKQNILNACGAVTNMIACNNFRNKSCKWASVLDTPPVKKTTDSVCIYGGTQAGPKYKDGYHCLVGSNKSTCPAKAKAKMGCWAYGKSLYYTVPGGTDHSNVGGVTLP